VIISILRSLDGVLTSADTAYLSVYDSTGSLFYGPAEVPPSSEGTYAQDMGFLTPGNYTAEWTFEVAGDSDTVVHRPFVVDGPATVYQGITLADIERGLAARTGPYRQLRCDANSSSIGVSAPKLRSTLALGENEDLYVLRRGVLNTGQLVPNFVPDDRIRIVDVYTPTVGLLTVDRAYSLTPIEDEMIELMAFDPDEELRPAVLEGLTRCYFWDSIDVTQTSRTGAINLTSLASWLTGRGQVAGVESALPYAITPMQPVQGYKLYPSGQSIYLDNPRAFLQTLRIRALRPVHTLVNERVSLVGPNDDWDILHVDKEYAVRAGHVALWIRKPELLTSLAAQGNGIPLSMAATAFTIRSQTMVDREPEFVRPTWGTTSLDQIGNAPEV
jgi:hypothetical protein